MTNQRGDSGIQSRMTKMSKPSAPDKECKPPTDVWREKVGSSSTIAPAAQAQRRSRSCH